MREQHCRLSAADQCYFLYEYYAKGGFGAGPGNQVIANLQKPVSKRGTKEYYYKEQDINRVATALAANIALSSEVTVVPMAPSRAKSDPEYDDRMLQIAQRACRGSGAHAQDLLECKATRQKLKSSTAPRDPQRIAANLMVTGAPASATVILLDDVITTGATFVASKQVLTQAFGGLTIYGVFVARRAIVVSEPDYYDHFDEDF